MPVYTGSRRALMGAPPLVPSLVFPSNIAAIDMDHENNLYAVAGVVGNFNPDNAFTSDDGRLLRQFITSSQPNYIEQLDGSLKTYTSGTAIRRSDIHGLFGGIDLSCVDLQNRTFTNAAWAVVGGTVVKDQIGRTGAANSCCRVTLTAATCTLTAAAAVVDATVRARMARIEAKQTLQNGGVVGALALSVDNAATFPAMADKAIAGVNARSFRKYSFVNTQSLANPQKQIKLTGQIGDVWVLDFSETLHAALDTDAQDYEMPPIATTGATVRVWMDRDTAAQVGYTGNTIAGPLALFLKFEASQAHYQEFWFRRDASSIFASDTGIQVRANVGGSGFTAYGLTSAVAGVGTLPIVTTDLRAPVRNRVWYGRKRGESFLKLNNGPLIVGDTLGAGVDASNPTMTHTDKLTNGAGPLRNAGGEWRDICTTNYDAMKALAAAA